MLLVIGKTYFLFASSRLEVQQIEVRRQLHILLVSQNEKLLQSLPPNKYRALPRIANQSSTWLISSATLEIYPSQHDPSRELH
jgi:hypothetical protein